MSNWFVSRPNTSSGRSLVATLYGAGQSGRVIKVQSAPTSGYDGHWQNGSFYARAEFQIVNVAMRGWNKRSRNNVTAISADVYTQYKIRGNISRARGAAVLTFSYYALTSRVQWLEYRFDVIDIYEFNNSSWYNKTKSL